MLYTFLVPANVSKLPSCIRMSSNGSNNSEEPVKAKRRVKKKQRKDKEEITSEDAMKRKQLDDRSELEEIKSSENSMMFKRHSTHSVQPGFNGGYISDDRSSNHSPKRKTHTKAVSERDEECRSSSSAKLESKIRLKVKKIDEEGIYHRIVGLLQSDERVKSIIKSERSNYKKLKYEFNKKKHFMGSLAVSNEQYKEEEQAGYREVIDSTLEKLESLQLPGFESLKQMHVKYLEDKLKHKNKSVNQAIIDEIKFMDIEQWENSLTQKEKRKIKKRNQDQRRIIKRLLESEIGLIDEYEI